MTTSEIPHHRHRYPQGDLPPLATPRKTTPQTAQVEPETALKNVAWSLLFWPVSLIRQGRTARPGRCPAVSAEHEEGKTARSVRKGYKHRTARECILPKARGTGTGRRLVQSAMASTMSAELGPGESPGCCSGSPARSCCGSPTGRCGARCSSRRRGSPGSRLGAAHR